MVLYVLYTRDKPPHLSGGPKQGKSWEFVIEWDNLHMDDTLTNYMAPQAPNFSLGMTSLVSPGVFYTLSNYVVFNSTSSAHRED